MEIEAFITERESTAVNVLVQALFVNEDDIFDFSEKKSEYHRRDFIRRLENMPWTDQVEFIRLIVDEKTRLEELRLKEERFFTEVKYIPPPIPRPRMPTKGNAGTKLALTFSGVTWLKFCVLVLLLSAHGGGVTGVPRFSEFLTNDEIAQSNSTSIASRSRKSTQQTLKTPAIRETFTYPRSLREATKTYKHARGTVLRTDPSEECVSLNSVASEEGSVGSASVMLIADHPEMPELHKYLGTNPPYLPCYVIEAVRGVLVQALAIRELKNKMHCFQESCMCPLLKRHVASSAEEQFSDGADDDGYQDILKISTHKYVLPGSTERVSLLNYFQHWMRSSSRLTKQGHVAEYMLLAAFDMWEDLHDGRQPHAAEVDDGDDDEWVQPEPSEEELMMPSNVLMAVEDISSLQCEQMEALQQCIACLVCIEVTFFDEWRHIFSQRGSVVYNPTDGLSSTYQLGLRNPSFHLACHFVGHEYLEQAVMAELIERAQPVVAKHVKKKKRPFKPKAGQRFSLLPHNVGKKCSPDTSLPAIKESDNTCIALENQRHTDSGRTDGATPISTLPPINRPGVRGEQ